MIVSRCFDLRFSQAYSTEDEPKLNRFPTHNVHAASLNFFVARVVATFVIRKMLFREQEFMELVHARARRRMSRGLKRKPMALIKRLRKAKKSESFPPRLGAFCLLSSVLSLRRSCLAVGLRLISWNCGIYSLSVRYPPPRFFCPAKHGYTGCSFCSTLERVGVWQMS